MSSFFIFVVQVELGPFLVLIIVLIVRVLLLFVICICFVNLVLVFLTLQIEGSERNFLGCWETRLVLLEAVDGLIDFNMNRIDRRRGKLLQFRSRQ
jgi:hypothetical protein